MSAHKFDITPYSPTLEDQLMHLESQTVQGKWIQLKMLRENYLSRSIVFDHYRILVARSQQGDIQGVAAGGIVPLGVEGEIFRSGFGYDLRVFKKWRHMGLATEFGRQLVEDYFPSKGIKNIITTSKARTVAVYKAALNIHQQWSDYDFSYLTLPVSDQLKISTFPNANVYFTASLLSSKERLKSFYRISNSGIGIWYTYKLYTLKIHRVHPLVSLFKNIQMYVGMKKHVLPREGDILKFVTLFDLAINNIHRLPTIFKDLKHQGIHYCNVVCRKGDAIYQALAPSAINTYDYKLIHNMDINEQKSIAIDVRCL